MRLKLLFILAFTFFGTSLFAQIFESTKPNLYLSPTITIGYTFRCGWNYGIDLTLGLQRIMPSVPEVYSAVNMQIFFINYKGDIHRIIDFNIVADSKIAQFGIGMGRIWKRWGYKSVNRDGALGYSLIFNLSPGDYRYPFFGVKVFVPTAKWTWSSLPYYFSYYTFWRREPFILH